jgi:hypothetical protein
MWAINRGKQHFYRLRHQSSYEFLVACVSIGLYDASSLILSGLLGVITFLFTDDIYLIEDMYRKFTVAFLKLHHANMRTMTNSNLTYSATVGWGSNEMPILRVGWSGY